MQNLQFMSESVLNGQIQAQKAKISNAKYNHEQHEQMKAYLKDLEAELKRRSEES